MEWNSVQHRSDLWRGERWIGIRHLLHVIIINPGSEVVRMSNALVQRANWSPRLNDDKKTWVKVKMLSNETHTLYDK